MKISTMQHNLSYWPAANPMNNMFTPQYPAYNPVPASPYLPTIPEVSGEGELMSIVYPDGNLQFYFVPTSVQWAGNYTNQNVAWHVKSISNPIPAAVFSQYHPQVYGNNQCIPMDFESKCKFHNDGCSSTTDLQYFYPNNVLPATWPKVETTVQNQPREMPYEMNPGYLNMACPQRIPNSEGFNVAMTNPQRIMPNTESMVVDEQTYKTKHRRSIMCPIKRNKKSKGVYFRSETSYASDSHVTSDSETEGPDLQSAGEQTDRRVHCCRHKHRKSYTDKLVVTYTDQKCGNNGSKGTNTCEIPSIDNTNNVETQSPDKEVYKDEISKELFSETLVKDKFDGNSCNILRYPISPPTLLKVKSVSRYAPTRLLVKPTSNEAV